MFKSLLWAAVALCLPTCLTLSSCNEEPDESNMYTFTGETIEDFIVNNEADFSSFNYILTRIGYDRILSSYGTYTCFLPGNKAIGEYIDSLYNDKDCDIPHNGMMDNSLEGLTDSLCQDIALYHLCPQKYLTTEMGESPLLTYLDRTITPSTRLTDGATVLNTSAAITMNDYEVVNGVIHVIDKVIARSNKLVSRQFKFDERFSIFYEALTRTGLEKELEDQYKTVNTSNLPTPTSGYYIPQTCKVGFTVFAETDEVLNRCGIFTFDDLAAKAAEWYGKSASGSRGETEGWYDYYRNNGIQVSTGTDYTNENNVVNMFVRYHILKTALSKDVVVLDHNVLTGYGYNGDAYDYYETMLPKTLVKAWKVKSLNKIYLNRYQTNNTLTDEVESMGSSSLHEVKFKGVEVLTGDVLEPMNGYIYPIDTVLVYDSQVPLKVLNERIRIDALTMLGEISSNGFRGMRCDALQAISGNKNDARIRFPVDFFDNVVVYNGNSTQIDMNVIAAPGAKDYSLYKGDSFQGMGIFDFAIKLPPVPDGVYEIRINLDCMTHGTMLQYYIGEKSDMAAMQPMDIPLDMRIDIINEGFAAAKLVEIGCVDINNDAEATADRGLASDKVMRSHNYMRGPLSVVRSSDGTTITRFSGHQLRRIMDTRDLKQQDYWLRLKTVLDDGNTERKFQVDYVEFVPISVAQNPSLLEDMY